MPSETTPADEKKKKEEDEKKKKSLAGQTEGMKPTPAAKTSAGPTSSQAYDRTHRHIGDEAGKRAVAEEAVAAAEVQARVQPVMDTPEKRADDWIKANGKALGLGNRAAFFNKIKQKMSPEEAWKAVGGK